MSTTTFGSTDKSDQLTDEQKAERERQAEQLNVAALNGELQLQRKLIDRLIEGEEHTQNLITTLMGRLQAIEEARVRELQLRVGNGPTA